MNNQIDKWSGKFGDEYLERNTLEDISHRCAFWDKIFKNINKDAVKSILEVGCNKGDNSIAINKIGIQARYFGIDVNKAALVTAINNGSIKKDDAMHGSSSKIEMKDGSVDLAFTMGVLIHVNPTDLLSSMKEIVRISNQYILCAEYFNDTPVTCEYRGNQDLLFKRDFGSMYMDNFKNLELISYGFEWKRITKLDNITWWLFKKYD